MKKLLMTMALFMLVSVIFANTPDNGEVKYQNYQVYKVYAHPDAYVVMYYTKGVELGQATIPAEWFQPTNGEKKGVLRLVEKTDFMPYFTVQTTDGTVTKVIMTMSSDRSHISWGIMDGSVDLSTEGQGNTLNLE